MYNPFEQLQQELSEIKEIISTFRTTTNEPAEIIDRAELMKRLQCTEPTIIRYVRRGKIPEIKLGANCRYNWPQVVKALEGKK